MWLTGGGGAPGAGGAGGAPDVAEDVASEVAAGAAVVLLAGAVTLSKPGMEDNFNIKIIQLLWKATKWWEKKYLLNTALFSPHVVFALIHLQTVSLDLSWIPPDTVVFKEW